MSEVDDDAAKSSLGCIHYRRRCRIVASCCNEVFWCRHCHNDAKRAGPGAHEIDRSKIAEVICEPCQEKQPPAKQCRKCGEVFGAYFCELCNFWDDEGITKQTYHCHKCGLCRVGGQDNFFHCDTCGGCYNIKLPHTCAPHAGRFDTQRCPICGESLFNSMKGVHRWNECGHHVHLDCLTELRRGGASVSRCTLCDGSQLDGLPTKALTLTASPAESGALVISCLNLAGEVVSELRVEAPATERLRGLRAQLSAEMAVPVFRLWLTLRDGRFLERVEDDQTLADVFRVQDDGWT